MLLTLVAWLPQLRWLLPTAAMMGASPAYLTAVLLWRTVTLLLPRAAWRWGDDLLYSTYNRQCLFYFEKWTGTEILFYGDTDAVERRSKGENVLFISNHQCTVDWVMAEAVAQRRGSLGRVRYVLKTGIKYLPLYGWYLHLHGSFYIKRSGFQKNTLKTQLAKANKTKEPMWLIIYPEGTRLNPESMKLMKSSKDFSESQGIPAFKHLLHPRLRGFHTCIQGLQGSVESVFDVTIAYSGTKDYKTNQRIPAPSMQDFLMGKCKKVHIHISRIPIEQVPIEEEALKQWLIQKYQEKDKLLDEFYSAVSEDEAKFPGVGMSRPLSLVSLLPSTCLWAGALLSRTLREDRGASYCRLAAGLGVVGVVWMGLKR